MNLITRITRLAMDEAGGHRSEDGKATGPSLEVSSAPSGGRLSILGKFGRGGVFLQRVDNQPSERPWTEGDCGPQTRPLMFPINSVEGCSRFVDVDGEYPRCPHTPIAQIILGRAPTI